MVTLKKKEKQVGAEQCQVKLGAVVDVGFEIGVEV